MTVNEVYERELLRTLANQPGLVHNKLGKSEQKAANRLIHKELIASKDEAYTLTGKGALVAQRLIKYGVYNE